MVHMSYLTPKQQRMLMYMALNGKLTKKEQPFYLSPVFFTYINHLVLKNLVKNEWKDGHLEYSLTAKGKALVDMLKPIIGEYSIKESEI